MNEIISEKIIEETSKVKSDVIEIYYDWSNPGKIVDREGIENLLYSALIIAGVYKIQNVWSNKICITDYDMDDLHIVQDTIEKLNRDFGLNLKAVISKTVETVTLYEV